MKQLRKGHGSSGRNGSAQATIGHFEALESRNLLAVDLHVVEDFATAQDSNCRCAHDAELQHHLVTDATGQYFIDPVPTAADLPEEFHEEAVLAVAGSTGPLVAIRHVPIFHSHPDAEQKIYLDFNGQRIARTGWNDSNHGRTIVAPAFDSDGDAKTFSSTELEAIERIWSRVAEDFAPFDIDVTTESPSARSFREGSKAIRVMISSNVDQETGNKWFAGGGGVGYVNSWRWTSDTPVWVFANKLRGIEKRIAEAASHEIGHALGLDHDGTISGDEYFNGFGGDIGWAPMMGAGYSMPVTQWSRGEYGDANNVQNDLAVITSNANGIRYLSDDHSFQFDSATRLELNASREVEMAGLISRPSDIDMFYFEIGAGEIEIDIRGARFGSNLDIEATLFDADGEKIAVDNPMSSLSAFVKADLPAGKYHLMIDGVGRGDPETDGYSEYGSIGRYTIRGTLQIRTIVIPPSEPIESERNSEPVEPPIKLRDAIVRAQLARRRLAEQVRAQVVAMILRSLSNEAPSSPIDLISLISLLDEIDRTFSI